MKFQVLIEIIPPKEGIQVQEAQCSRSKKAED